MNVTSMFALASFVLSMGLGIYFLSRKIFTGLAVTVMMLLTALIATISVRSGLKILVIGYTVLLLIVCGLCFVLEMSMPAPSRRKHKRGQDDNDDEDDEYISTAPTMTVRQIRKAYTNNPDEAERRYTNNPMNVTGIISRVTNSENYSHVELDGIFLCICPQGSVRSLRAGMRVSITGILRGQLLLDDCVMVKHPV